MLCRLWINKLVRAFAASANLRVINVFVVVVLRDLLQKPRMLIRCDFAICNTSRYIHTSTVRLLGYATTAL